MTKSLPAARTALDERIDDEAIEQRPDTAARIRGSAPVGNLAGRLGVVGFALAFIALLSPVPALGLPLAATALALSLAGIVRTAGGESRRRVMVAAITIVSAVGLLVAYLAS